MNKLYGPCVSVPILMFHHVEDMTKAKEDGHASLTVGLDYFKKDLEYLSSKGYTTIFPADLISFFDNGVALPAKPVMLTFDDGYDDNGAEMYQMMKEAAAQHVPVYLETHTENNVSYYQALGFECLERVITPSYELPFWCLVWRPQDGGASQ